MCLGTVARVVEMANEAHVVVEHGAARNGAVEDGAAVAASRRETVLDMTDENIGLGDWVVIHSGFALERISEAQALDALAIRATPPPTEPPPATPAAPHHKEMAP